MEREGVYPEPIFLLRHDIVVRLMRLWASHQKKNLPSGVTNLVSFFAIGISSILKIEQVRILKDWIAEELNKERIEKAEQEKNSGAMAYYSKKPEINAHEVCFEILFRKSVHPFTYNEFHNCCDYRAPLLLVMNAKDNQDVIFGAYMHEHMNQLQTNTFIEDKYCFLFTFNPNTGDKKGRKFKCNNPGRAFQCGEDAGIMLEFGEGPDLRISCGSDGNFANFPHTFGSSAEGDTKALLVGVDRGNSNWMKWKHLIFHGSRNITTSPDRNYYYHFFLFTNPVLVFVVRGCCEINPLNFFFENVSLYHRIFFFQLQMNFSIKPFFFFYTFDSLAKEEMTVHRAIESQNEKISNILTAQNVVSLQSFLNMHKKKKQQ
ncbi:hypothetical protein RFI_06780 [Reticulomyxa filosa]|uniref:TLDc domain-containing protein n=1 Tax=Reticulomyxa filosa TaxID=46433 RepID=X6NWT6_RETFI|nr:hypothetical protein RFI_06780 [Reticulomyxa filosa]|eukprot:ETO30338.1 hypothetical protein RFI_06780 [Reticulomyxa filosa]